MANGAAKAPSVPSATQELEPRPRHQQWAAPENQPIELQTGATAANSLSQPLQNVQSLTEPGTISSSTSRITNQDSLGSEILPTSSISQQLSELVAPIPKLAQAVTFDQTFFVAPHWPMDAEMKDIWDRKIYERLTVDLENNGRGVCSLEFFMAGKNKRNPRLKPTIVITCTNAESRTAIKSFVENLYWLKEYDRLHCFIGLNSQKRRAEFFTKAPAVPDPLGLLVTANLGLNTSTLCGLSAAIKGPRVQINSPFRLGGTILVKGEVFCLTAGHIANLQVSDDLSEDLVISELSQEATTTDSDDESFFFTIGGSAGDGDVDSVSDNSEMTEEESESGRIAHEASAEKWSMPASPNLTNWTEIGELESSTISGLNADVVSPRIFSDWALIRVTNKSSWLGNSVQIPGNSALTAIEHFVPESQISATQVWAVTRSHSPRPGLLSESPATLFLHGKTLRVRQITFEDALVPGDSGTWVIQGGRLCGHIVAGRKGLKWAYMVPIETIFNHIKECFNATDSEVSILTAPVATYLRDRDTVGPRLNLHPQKMPVVDPSPVALETVSNLTSRRQLREEENEALSTHSLIQTEPILDTDTFVNRFKKVNTLLPPQSFPQQAATWRDSYVSLDTSSAHDHLNREMTNNARGLHRWHLGRWQVMLLVFSGVIGSNMYANDGKALKVAGPAGALIAFAVVGVIATAVMESISEMMQLFPGKNALVEFVRVFVDEDLAWVVGLSYWQSFPHFDLKVHGLMSYRYTYATIFASLAITAAQFSEYWGLKKAAQIGIFYVFAPFVIFIINSMPTRVFGQIAAGAGLLKFCFVAGCVIFMIIVLEKQGNENKYIQDGFKHNDSVAKNPLAAICYCIPFVAYGFLGVEIVTIMGAEARRPKTLTWTSRHIALLIMVLFLLLTVLEFINISWLDARLPTIWFNTTDANSASATHSTAVLVLIAQKYGAPVFPGLLTGCMIYSVLSASNIALYVASRSLYGVARHAQAEKRRLTWLSRPLSKVGTTSRNGIPQWALVISAISFIWVPFVSTANDVTVQDLIRFITLSGTMCCVLVWACHCVAYIRCQYWLRKHGIHNEEQYSRFNRSSRRYAGRTILSYFQPFLAWLGLCGCLCIVFVCGSSLWWSSEATIAKVLGAYGAPIAVWATWSGRKVYLWWKCRHYITASRWPFVQVNNVEELRRLLDGMGKPMGEDFTEEQLRSHERAAHTGFAA